jgi:SAM-dependent methyltransferase
LAKGEGDRFIKLFKSHHFKFPYRFEHGDANNFKYLKLGKFDTIISVGAFHHFYNFESIFQQLNQIITEQGLVFVDEFIGPTKWQYKTPIIDQINTWLSTLPDNLIANRKVVKPGEFYQIWKNSLDHSESIRSSELDYWLRKSFRIITAKPFGGTLLMPFFLTAYLKPSRLNIENWHHTENGQIQLRKIVLQEKRWISSGNLEAHYMYYVLGKKQN